MQGSTSLKDRGTNTLYGTSWAMFRKSCYLKQGSVWGILRNALNWGLILLSPPQPGQAAKGTPGQSMRLCGGQAASTGQWQKRARYLQSHQRVSLPKAVLAAGVCVADEVSCTLSQILEVPGRDNTAESELVTTLAGTGVREFCRKLAAETPTVKVCIISCARWDLISLRTKLIEHLVNYWGN